MKINSIELLHLLSDMKSIVLGWKGILDIQGKFIFLKNGIMAYNDKEMIFKKYDFDFECIVPAEPFFILLENIEEQSIMIMKKENHLNLKSNSIDMNLNIIELDISFIKTILNDIEEISWKRLPKKFMQGLKLSIFSAAPSLTHPILSAICIKENFIMSSDNFRITLFDMRKNISDLLLIPSSSVKEILKLNLNFYGIKDNWLFMKTENFYFCCRIMEGIFPSVLNFFDIEGDKIIIPLEFKRIIETSSVMVEGENEFEKRITILIDQDIIQCKCETNFGNIKGIGKIDHKKKKIEFQINPKFLLDILDICNELIYNENYVLFYSENFRHLISLYEKESE